MTNTLHAHIESSSTDCDGTVDRSYIERFNYDEVVESQKQVNDFSDINFRDRVLTLVANPFTCVDGTLRVTGDPATGRTQRLSWTESTEEGGRSIEAVFCEDDCKDYRPTYRDRRAESMGY